MAAQAPYIGGGSGGLDLDEAVFGETFHEPLVHRAVMAELNAKRKGTASTLTRGQVAMTGAKAWRQKGTGRARVGALSVPHRRGGGNAFATKPRNYTFKVNRKARRKALRAALSVHADRDSVAVLNAADYSGPSTKQAAEALAKWGARTPTLLVLEPEQSSVLKSFRNLTGITVMPASAVGVGDVIGHRSLIVSQEALTVLEARAVDVTRGSGGVVEAE